MHQVCNTLVLVYLQNWPLSSPQNAHHLKGKAPAERCLFPATSLFSPSPGLHICYVSTLPMGRPHSGSPGSYSAAQHGPGLVLANVLHTALLPPSCPPALLPLLTEGHTEDMDYLCSDSHQVVNICMVLTFWLL